MSLSWDRAGLTALVTHEDISKASRAPPTPDAPTPILALSSQSRAKGYDGLCLPLTTESWKKRWMNMCLLPEGMEEAAGIAAEKRAEAWRARPGFLLNEVTLTQLDEAEGVIALVSEWLELDSNDDWVRHDAEIALQQELSYATYLNIHTAILPPPRSREHLASYARVVNACLKASPYMHISIRLPIYNPSVLESRVPPGGQSPSSMVASPPTPRLVVSDDRGAETTSANLDGTWEMWDVIRSMCDYNTRLSLTLDLTPPLPVNSGFLSKWKAEAVRHLFLPASTFIANTKGYPVLPKGTQSFIRDSITASRQFASTMAEPDEDQNLASPKYYPGWRKSGSSQSRRRSCLFTPLMDNLQSVTYQTFEQDPVKYHNYEEAVFHALLDWPGNGRIVICVAGAGRGPIVSRCLNAIERAAKDAHVYAVEKNPSAFVTLQTRKETEWEDKVTLIFGDMRSTEPVEKADILVKVVIGSCPVADSAADDGISIPSSYTAHLAPLSSSKLYNEARGRKDEKGLETPYVVMFQAVNLLSGDGECTQGRCGPSIQECWEFEHPRPDAVLDERGLPLTNSHNVRSAKLNFFIPHAGVLHGLAGYFEAVLYGNIGLSIHPQRKDRISKDMLSWFPLFFPFKEPLYLPSNSELQVNIWRLTNQRQVWYEWHAENFLNVNAPPSPETEMPPRSPALGNGAFFSSPRNIPSPLVDAMPMPADIFALDPRRSEAGTRLIKIGHTSLHNPGGRSSWIGL
ncbi:unnamed protein product [Mycena citricolor]|uniref:Protein arginine N-methyltransferase n=1 Tax=Mycena citricolor TaxID=2018698 RepID=A0AAD2H6H1_9AGAR|nr:unnamed protein product [Mycena citricolor]